MNPNQLTEKQSASESILIVDDTPANLRLLSEILQQRGYQVRAAANGRRALASVAAEPPDLILLDIRMPELDGYEVCLQLKERSQSRDIPVLFISALDEIQDKMKAFAVGGLDYITKPFQVEEVVARVDTHLALRRLQKNLLEANQRMQNELELAAQVQASMMRRRFPNIPDWQLAVKLIPAKQTCGDFFDVLRLPDRQIGLIIADVVDKGVGAALYMSMSCALLRTYVMEYPTQPAQALAAVNQRILEDTTSDQFVTVFLGVLDPQTGRLLYSNAGHNPPVLARPLPKQPTNPAGGSSSITELARTGMALGVISDSEWQQAEAQLAPGDGLVLYTDGVTDAENSHGKEYDVARLHRVVQSNLHLPAEGLRDAIIADIDQWTGAEGATAPSGGQFDDIALMILKYTG